MAYPFQRTLRSLNGEESGTRGILLVLGAIALCGLLGWILFAQIPVVKVSLQARVEPHNAVHRIEPSEAGKVLRSMLRLDEMVEKGDLLVEFDSKAERLELAQSKATLTSLTQELAIAKEQIANKEQELDASSKVDEAALREAVARELELRPRRKLAEHRAELAKTSPNGSISELEKLERLTEADELIHANRTQSIGIERIRREQTVRREGLVSQLLSLKRDALRMEGQVEQLNVTVDKLEYQIERKQLRAAASGRLVDVVELAAGAFIVPGQRLGSIVATDSSVRIRARFPKETVGVVRAGQHAQLKLDGYPWTIYGTVPAKVTRVGTEPGIVATPEAIPGTVRVELDIETPPDQRIILEHGLTATAEIEVARVTPAELLMRAIGEWNYTAPDPTEQPPVRTFQAEAEAR